MKRRLNLAAGLLHDPDILLLDEPTVGVDPQSRNAIFDNLEALKRRGKALLYTTHYMEEAERLADRIVVIDHGRVIANDTLAGLQARVAGVAGGRATLEVGVPHADRKEPARLMALTPFLAMVRKDLQLFFSDRRAVIMSFVVPIAIASFFGSIFSGPRQQRRAGADRRRHRRSGRQRDLEGHRRRRRRRTRICRCSTPAEDEARDAVQARHDHASPSIIPQGFGDAAGQAFFGGGEKPALDALVRSVAQRRAGDGARHPHRST